MGQGVIEAYVLVSVMFPAVAVGAASIGARVRLMAHPQGLRLIFDA